MATAEKEKGRRRRFQSIHSGWEFTCGRQEKSFFLPPSPHLCFCVNLSLSCGGNSFDLMAQWDLILGILYFLIGSYLQSPLQTSRALMKPTLQNATCGFGFSCPLHVSGLHGLAGFVLSATVVMRSSPWNAKNSGKSTQAAEARAGK